MILLFGEKAHKSGKSSNIKNHPVENSGILAMNKNNVPSLLSANEYDSYIFSTQAVIDFSQYTGEGNIQVAFMSGFSDAISTLSSEGGSFASFSGDCSSSCSCSCGGFSSMC